MINIDRYAYANKLIALHPMEKFAFTVITMALCLLSTSFITPLAVLATMSLLIILRARIPARFFLRLMMLPVSFLLMGVLTIAFSVSQNPHDFLTGIGIFGYTVGVRAADIMIASHLFLKSLASVSCLYFLSLTTPMVDLMSVLRKLKVPELFIELMGLIYRFVFVMMETTSTIRISQNSRLGYSSLKNSFYSISQLFSSLFIRAFHRSQELSNALKSRCYNGNIVVLEKEYSLSKRNLILIVLFEVVLVLTNVYIRG